MRHYTLAAVIGLALVLASTGAALAQTGGTGLNVKRFESMFLLPGHTLSRAVSISKVTEAPTP